MKVKISIVTVCYNAENLIDKTMLSVIEQSYNNIEYILIDGASTDSTLNNINNIIIEYSKKDIILVSEPDRGVYDAMNKGIRIASGDFILFLNAGDSLYDKHVIENVVSSLDFNTDVIFGDVAIVFNNGAQYIERANPFYLHMPLHHSMGFNHQGTFVSVKLAKKYEFDLKYRYAADYNMIITLYQNKAKFQQLNMVISNYLYGGISQVERKRHIMETLIIDNPNRLLYNRLLLYIIYFKSLICSFIKESLFNIIPSFGEYIFRVKNSKH